MLKLFIVVRADLDLGLQMAQAIHASIQFVFEHPEEAKAWYCTSNNVVVKQVPNEAALAELVQERNFKRTSCQVFGEPDLQGAWTAAAFMGEGANAYLRELPLAPVQLAQAA